MAHPRPSNSMPGRWNGATSWWSEGGQDIGNNELEWSYSARLRSRPEPIRPQNNWSGYYRVSEELEREDSPAQPVLRNPTERDRLEREVALHEQEVAALRELERQRGERAGEQGDREMAERLQVEMEMEDDEVAERSRVRQEREDREMAERLRLEIDTEAAERASAERLRLQMQVEDADRALAERLEMEMEREERDGAEKEREEREAAKREEEKKQQEEREGTRKCVICLDEGPNHAVVPCGHVVYCEECAGSVEPSPRRCPVCRTRAECLFRVYLA